MTVNIRCVKSKVDTDNKKFGISYILLLNIVKTDEISNLMITETHTSFESSQKTIYRLFKDSPYL